MEKIQFSKNLDENIAKFQSIFTGDNTLVTRRVKSQSGQLFAIFFFDGMVSGQVINRDIVAPLTAREQPVLSTDVLIEQVLRSNEAAVQTDTEQLMLACLYGDSVVFMEGDDTPVSVNTKGFDTRSTSEPENERVLSGPREGFTESFMTNLSMIRRRIQNSDLKFTFMRIGEKTNTTVCLCYVNGLCEESLVREMKKRLARVEIDSLLDSNYLAEEIADHRWSLFPTIGTSERPDVIASRMLEGRCAIVVDGSPVVLTAPYIFQECFQSSDDYYLNYWQSNVARVLRVIGYFASISIAGIYVAIMLYHRELVPNRLLFAMLAAHRGVPFAIEWETCLMLVIFEALKEAGSRTPGPMGQAMSIVGGLVLGQAAVSARFSAAPTVIITATIGVTSLMAPKLQGSSILLRFVVLFAGASFGLYGVMVVLAITLMVLCKMNSCSVPYLLNMVPRVKTHQRDTFIRAPWFLMPFRRNLKRKGEKH